MQEFISDYISPGRTGRAIHFSMMLLVIALLTTCKKEEVATKEYPRLNTLEVTEISETGATFNAEVISGDLSQIKKCGFVWSLGNDPNLENSDVTIIGGKIENGSFRDQVSNSMIKDQNYFVRPFIVTDKYTVYGKVLSFKSLGCKAPSIKDFYPKQGNDLDTISIIGDNFSSFNMNNTVFLDDQNVKVIQSEKTKLKIVLPANDRTGNFRIRIIVANLETESADLLKIKGVTIFSVEPKRGLIGKSIISITGEQFSLENDKNILTINGIRIELLTVTETKITFRLPLNTPPGDNKFIISVNNKNSEYKGVFESVSPWTKNMELPIQTNGYNSAFTLNGKMYVQYRHSFNENNFFEYNPSTNQLLFLARYPGMMQNRGVGFVLNGKGYVGAGVFYSSYSGLAEFHTYDPVTNTWTKVGGLPDYSNGGPIGAIAFSVQNKAYLFGGFAQNYYATKGLDYYVYDPILDHWSLLGNMKKLINYDEWSKAAGFMIDDNIYLSSGSARNYFYNYSSYKKTWMFDIANGQWTQLADFPVDREDAVGFSINGKGYIGIGSYNGTVKSDFYEYDPINDTWTRIADLPTKGSIGSVAVVIGGKAYILANDNKEIWEFDPLKQ